MAVLNFKPEKKYLTFRNKGQWFTTTKFIPDNFKISLYMMVTLLKYIEVWYITKDCRKGYCLEVGRKIKPD